MAEKIVYQTQKVRRPEARNPSLKDKGEACNRQSSRRTESLKEGETWADPSCPEAEANSLS